MVIPEDKDNVSSLTDQLETPDITSEDPQAPFSFFMCDVFFIVTSACTIVGLVS